MSEEKNIPVEETKETPSQPKDQVKNKKNVLMLVINIILALITIVLLGYIAYKNGYVDLGNIFNQQEEQNIEEDNDEEEESSEEAQEDEEEEENIVVENNGEEELTTYEGTYISAVLPSDWTIIEYSNGEGTDMLVEGVDYTGITGLEIIDENDTLVFDMLAVSGIGFVGCSELPIFDDSSEEYLQENQDMNDEVGMEMNVLDYTEEEYSDIEWMGKDFRRVNTYLYFDTVEDNEYFEPQCEAGLITVPEITFVDSDGYEGLSYFYGISEDVDEETLELLDQILTSMEAI